MAETQRNIASFLVRFTQDLWQDAEGNPNVQWRGRITHVQGDDELPFTDFTDAVTFIQRELTQLTLEAASATETMDSEKTLRESLKLWDTFAATYSSMLIQAMDQTVKHSQTLQDQMQEAIGQTLERWAHPATTRYLMDRIESLQAQVDALSSKIDALGR